jgi:hypothetical protein
VWQVLRQARENFLAGKSGLLRQARQNIRPNGLLKLLWRNLRVRTGTDPGICDLAVAVLTELVDEFAKSATQQAAGARAAKATQQSAESTQAATEPPKAAGLLTGLPRMIRRAGLLSAQHLRNFIPVLETGDSEKSQKGCHGRKATAAHVIAPDYRTGTAGWAKGSGAHGYIGQPTFA